MSDPALMVVVFIVGLTLAMVVRHWYRRRKAAKLADDLLKDVLKSKDAFRR